MKATLEFTLPEEQEEFEHATQAQRYHSALHALYSDFRGKRKYAEEPATWEEVWEIFWAQAQDCLRL